VGRRENPGIDPAQHDIDRREQGSDIGIYWHHWSPGCGYILTTAPQVPHPDLSRQIAMQVPPCHRVPCELSRSLCHPGCRPPRSGLEVLDDDPAIDLVSHVDAPDEIDPSRWDGDRDRILDSDRAQNRWRHVSGYATTELGRGISPSIDGLSVPKCYPVGHRSVVRGHRSIHDLGHRHLGAIDHPLPVSRLSPSVCAGADHHRPAWGATIAIDVPSPVLLATPEVHAECRW
jgi:hypothetical protein